MRRPNDQIAQSHCSLRSRGRHRRPFLHHVRQPLSICCIESAHLTQQPRPICATLPPLEDILAAPIGQALPYIFSVVMDSPGGGLGLTLLVLIITLFCSISITVAASRCTWAFARDRALPLAHVWAAVDTRHGTPIRALALTTLVQMLLGLINLGSSSAFLAFVSVGVISLAVSYGIPIAISMFHRRREVNGARWTMGRTVGWVVNIVALLWIMFETVLFSMPTTLPVTAVSMNYAIVVFFGFMVMSAIWYAVHARKGRCSRSWVVPMEQHGDDAKNNNFSLSWTARIRRSGGFLLSLATSQHSRCKRESKISGFFRTQNWQVSRESNRSLRSCSRFRSLLVLFQIVYVLPRPRTLLSKQSTVPAQDERNGDKNKRQASEECSRPFVSQVREQAVREKRENRPK